MGDRKKGQYIKNIKSQKGTKNVVLVNRILINNKVDRNTLPSASKEDRYFLRDLKRMGYQTYRDQTVIKLTNIQ